MDIRRVPPLLTFAASLILGLGCTRRLDGAPCPCASGWTCCDDVCRIGSTCRPPLDAEVDSPAEPMGERDWHDSGSLADSDFQQDTSVGPDQADASPSTESPIPDGGMSTGGAPAATGGMPAATGGMPAATGGVTATTGGATTATGGVTATTGGVTTATGGVTATTGGATTATGGVTATTGGVTTLETTDEVAYVVTPDRVCGGAFMTNGWLVTANSCVDCGRKAEDLSVQLGARVSKVSEMVRYPEGNCSPGSPASSRDVMLLRLASPMTIGVNTYGYRRNIWPGITNHAWVTDNPSMISCKGWFMTPGSVPLVPGLHGFAPGSVKAQLDVIHLANNIGDLYWLTNSNLIEPRSGRFFTPQDIGSPCFFKEGRWSYVLGIYTPAPPRTLNTGYTEFQQARVSSMGDLNTQRFIDAQLFSTKTFGGFPLRGSAIAPAAVTRQSTDYYWISDSNRLAVRRRQGEVMGDTVDLGIPLADNGLLIEKPSVLIHDETLTSIWVRDIHNALWVYLRSTTAAPTWVNTGVTSLVHAVTPVFVDSKIQLITRDSLGIGMYATVENTLNSASSWQHLPDGTRMASDFAAGFNRIYARGQDDRLYAMWYREGAWWGGDYCWGTDAYGAPAVAAWDFDTVDLFYTNSLGHLSHKWLDWEVNPAGAPLDLGIPVDGTSLAATTSGRGAMEIVARTGDILQVIRYPR